MVVKSNTSLNSQIKHLQEELRSNDEIINQTLALLSNITNNELQSKNDTVNKLTDALIASNQHCGKEDINILEHEKNNNKNKNNNEKDDIERSNNAIKVHFKNAKISHSPKKTQSNDENVHKIHQKKTQIKIVRHSAVNVIEERGMSKANLNYGHNNMRIFDVLSNFPFTTSETKPDYW